MPNAQTANLVKRFRKNIFFFRFAHFRLAVFYSILLYKFFK